MQYASLALTCYNVINVGKIVRLVLKKEPPCELTPGEALIVWLADVLNAEGSNLCGSVAIQILQRYCKKIMEDCDKVLKLEVNETTMPMLLFILDRTYIAYNLQELSRRVLFNVTDDEEQALTHPIVETISYNLIALMQDRLRLVESMEENQNVDSRQSKTSVDGPEQLRDDTVNAIY